MNRSVLGEPVLAGGMLAAQMAGTYGCFASQTLAAGLFLLARFWFLSSGTTTQLTTPTTLTPISGYMVVAVPVMR